MKTQKIFFATIILILGVLSAFSAFAQVVEQNANLTTKQPITDSKSTNIPLQTSSSAGNVLWDLTHGVYLGYEPSTKYSNLVTALSSAGYMVTTTTDINSANLSSYKVLVVSLGSAWNSAYTTAEKSKIQTFVQNGGGLLIMGDNPGTPNANINSISQTFGITLGGAEYNGTSITNFASHPIFAGVTKLYFLWFGEVSVSSPSSLVAWDPGNKGCVAVAQSGLGRVVATGDINFCENAYLGNESNQKFSINIFDWL
ncbi:MAG: hypothetical protein ONB16_10675, partial [candidate division KSB1 bacterium]|nr:hypothetical protein [candidate division KSB1 bacterium]